MAHYLVTGVAGFIGSMVAKRLLSDGHTVIGVDNLSTGFLEAVPAGVSFIEAGIHEKETMSQLESEKFDAILHIAGQSGGEMSYEDPVYDLQANTQSTLLLLQLAKKINCTRVLYASTVSVYGEQENPEKISEDAPTFPKSFYGVGKLASEHYLRLYADQFNIESAALRLFNVYGPGQNLKNFKQGIASIYLAQALKNHHIHIKGSPDRFRDMVYIDDVVDAFCVLLKSPLKGSAIYNVSTAIKTTVGQLVSSIENALPFETTREFSGSTPGDVFGNTGCSKKLTADTGWKAKIDLNTGIDNMVKWALEQ